MTCTGVIYQCTIFNYFQDCFIIILLIANCHSQEIINMIINNITICMHHHLGWIAFKMDAELSRLLISIRTSLEDAFVEKVLRELVGYLIYNLNNFIALSIILMFFYFIVLLLLLFWLLWYCCHYLFLLLFFIIVIIIIIIF